MKFSVWLEEENPAPKVVDTNDDPNDNQYKLGNAAGAEQGYIWGWHVTDQPEKIANVLQSGKKVIGSYGPGRGRGNEMGPGLYFSGVPHMWMNRSIDKWEFIDRLTPDEKQRLADAIVKESENRTLASFEKEYLQRDIKAFLNTPNPSNAKHHIIHLAGLPYAIRFWEPQFLNAIGIEAGKQPEKVEVRVKGKFVDLSNKIRGGLHSWRPYLMQGYDGAFLKQSFEVVVWRNEAIIKFGEYHL